MTKRAGKRHCSPDKETTRMHITMNGEAKRCLAEAGIHYKAILGEEYSSSLIIRQALRLLATMLRETKTRTELFSPEERQEFDKELAKP